VVFGDSSSSSSDSDSLSSPVGVSLISVNVVVVVLVQVGQLVVVGLDEVVVLVLEVDGVIKGLTSVGCSIF